MRRAARGFTLVEIMVAMTILVITLGGFAAATFQYMRRVKNLNAKVAQMAVVGEQAQRLTVLPFDSLNSRAGCTTYTTGVLPYTRCITVTATTTTRYQVKIVITPTNTALKPDTVWFHRTKPASSALCTGC